MTLPMDTERFTDAGRTAVAVDARAAAATLGRALGYLAPLVMLAALWQALSWLRVLNPKIVPSFISVVAAGMDLLAEGEIFRHLIVTIYRAEAGMLLGVVLGVALGLAMARLRLVYRLSYPLVALTYTLPKTALIPIVFLWLGVGDASSIFVVLIGAFVPIVITTYHGAESTPEIYVWSAQSMGMSNRQVLWTIVFPASLPQVLNGVRIAQAFSIVIAISAEMVASYVGVGRFIYLYGEAGNYNYMFAAIFVVILSAFLLDQMFVVLKNRLLRWTESEGASDE